MAHEGIEKLFALAKLDMNEEERQTFPGQIEAILSYVDALRSLDLPDDAPELTHVAARASVWREDEPEELSEADLNRLVEAFPESVGRLNAVPGVFAGHRQAGVADQDRNEAL